MTILEQILRECLRKVTYESRQRDGLERHLGQHHIEAIMKSLLPTVEDYCDFINNPPKE